LATTAPPRRVNLQPPNFMGEGGPCSRAFQTAVDRLAEGGYGLVGDISQYEHIWRMANVRGPEGIIVSRRYLGESLTLPAECGRSKVPQSRLGPMAACATSTALASALRAKS
jgi:hypothetical protein